MLISNLFLTIYGIGHTIVREGQIFCDTETVYYLRAIEFPQSGRAWEHYSVT